MARLLIRLLTDFQLSLSTASSLHLLTPAEKELCSQLRILPKPYLFIKQTILREYARRGGQLTRKEMRTMFRFDPAKTNRIFDSLLKERLQAISNGHYGDQTSREGSATREEQIGAELDSTVPSVNVSHINGNGVVKLEDERDAMAVD